MNDSTGAGRNRRLISRFMEILNSNDLDALGEVLHKDWVQELPQSGERIRGIDNVRAVFSHYPGSEEAALKSEIVDVVGDEPHYVMTPTFNLVHIEGTGDTAVAVSRSRYPDGSLWWVINFFTVGDDKIVRDITYFSPAFPAPEWRAQWVERMGDGHARG